MNQLDKNSKIYLAVHDVVSKAFRPVVDRVPPEKRDERELIEGRYLSACNFVASVASLFSAYKSLLTPIPDSMALIRALGDLAYGFETNQFFGTFRGYLHPVLMNSINAWMDSVDYGAQLAATDNQTTRNLFFASENAWLEIIPAVAFCFGGFALSREVSSNLKEQVLRAI